MTREEKISRLITYLIEENPGYASIPEPVNEVEKRRLLRALMNVHWPGEASEMYYRLQDELLQEELEEKGVVRAEDIPTWERDHPASGLRHPDRISLWQGDITRLAVDGIVNAANKALLGCFIPNHNCIDNVIHSAAGMQLRDDCAKLIAAQGREEECGDCKLTRAYNLPSRYVLHTVGPMVRREVTERDRALLRACYHSCLDTALEAGISSVAFCCISTGVFSFPREEAAAIAVGAVLQWKMRHRDAALRVLFNTFLDEDTAIYRSILNMV